MKLSLSIFAFVLTTGALAQSCGWFLNPDDCMCMNSTTGALLTADTADCCGRMGLKPNSKKLCHVDRDNRQTFKDCCKWLDKPSLIGHCR